MPTNAERIQLETKKLELVKNKTKLGELLPAKVEPVAVRKLDIGCGKRKTKGYKGIDLGGDADISHDLFSFPWPIKTGSVKEIQCNHFLEHIPHYRPEWNGQDGWWMFFSELYRIMAKDATAEFTHPYSRSDRAFWDPTHTRYIHEMSYYYLNREWREMNQLDHYMPDVNFDIVTIDGQLIPDDIVARSDEYQTHARAFWFNVVNDLHVILKKA